MYNRNDLFLWVILAVIWGSSYTMIRIGVSDLTPLGLVTIRLNIAAIILLLIMRIRRQSMRLIWQYRWVCLFSGVFGNLLPFFLISVGERSVNSAVAALLMGLMPIITVVIAPFMLPNEAWSLRKFIALVLGFTGLVFIATPSGQSSDVFGLVAIVLAACSYAATTLTMRKYAPNLPWVMASGSMLVGAVFSLIILAMRDWQIGQVTTFALLAIVYLGVFSTAFATALYFYLLPRLGASRMAQINFLVPLVGVILGVVLLNETLGWNIIIAVCLILAALYLSLFHWST